MAGHVSALLDTCARTLYGLRVLRAHGLHQDCMDEVFRCRAYGTGQAAVRNPPWPGFCSAADIGKLDRFLNRCRKLIVVGTDPKHFYFKKTVLSPGNRAMSL